MHNHIHAFGPSLLNTYSARTLDRSEAAQRAADVRKKLEGGSREVEVDTDTDMDMEWLVRPGYEAAGYGERGRKAYPTKSDAEVEEPDEAGKAIEPISVWA